jgi:metal-responsive CopG/Arc/MetJ family transcriptional regulator
MKNIIGKTIGVNDILLNCIETISDLTNLTRSEVIRNAIDVYLEKTSKLLNSLSTNDKRFRSDKKYFEPTCNPTINIITCGLKNEQLTEIDNIIPGITSSRSEFIRTAIF